MTLIQRKANKQKKTKKKPENKQTKKQTTQAPLGLFMCIKCTFSIRRASWQKIVGSASLITAKPLEESTTFY